MVCGLGYRHFSTRTPNRSLSAGGKMWILGSHLAVRSKAADSLAGQALRTAGALLIGAEVEGSARGIVAREQTALIADAQSAVGALMDRHWAAHAMDALRGRRQLEHQVFEGDGVVVAHDPFMFARPHQLQLDPAQFGQRAVRLRRLDRKAPIAVSGSRWQPHSW